MKYLIERKNVKLYYHSQKKMIRTKHQQFRSGSQGFYIIVKALKPKDSAIFLSQ